jgi:hypothetical protein
VPLLIVPSWRNNFFHIFKGKQLGWGRELAASLGCTGWAGWAALHSAWCKHVGMQSLLGSTVGAPPSCHCCLPVLRCLQIWRLFTMP